MKDYNTLKSEIQRYIRANNNQEITGEVLQSVLISIVSNVGENAGFGGIAKKTTSPGTPDGPVFYFATEQGVYPNFGGLEIEKENTLNIIYNTEDGWDTLYLGNLVPNEEVKDFQAFKHLENTYFEEASEYCATFDNIIEKVGGGAIRFSRPVIFTFSNTALEQGMIINMPSSNGLITQYAFTKGTINGGFSRRFIQYKLSNLTITNVGEWLPISGLIPAATTSAAGLMSADDKKKLDIYPAQFVMDFGLVESQAAGEQMAAASEVAGNRNISFIRFQVKGVNTLKTTLIMQWPNGINETAQIMCVDKAQWRRNVTGATGVKGAPTNAFQWERTAPHYIGYDATRRMIQLKDYQQIVSREVELPLVSDSSAGLFSPGMFSTFSQMLEKLDRYAYDFRDNPVADSGNISGTPLNGLMPSSALAKLENYPLFPQQIGEATELDNGLMTSADKQKLDAYPAQFVLDLGLVPNESEGDARVARSEVAGNRNISFIRFQTQGVSGLKTTLILQYPNGINETAQIKFVDKTEWRRNVTGATGVAGAPTNAFTWERTAPHYLGYDAANRKIQLKDYMQMIIKDVELPLATASTAGLLSVENYQKIQHLASEIERISYAINDISTRLDALENK